TLLKLLDGLLFPDAGRYAAFGEAVTEDNLEDEQYNAGFRARIGFVFQNSDAQVFSPSVREEIAFGPLNMGMATEEVEQRVDDTTDRVLADRALLRGVNLVHEHAHAHGAMVHVHEHAVHHHD